MRSFAPFFALLSVLATQVYAADPCASPSQSIQVNRAFNDALGDHFYTTDPTEYKKATAGGYFAEGPRFSVFPTPSAPNTVQLIRLYNGVASDHFYTTDPTEASSAVSGAGYTVENLAPMYIYTTQLCGSVPLYRTFNAGTGDHFYTTSTGERDGMTGYVFEHVAGYVLPLATAAQASSSTTARAGNASKAPASKAAPTSTLTSDTPSVPTEVTTTAEDGTSAAGRILPWDGLPFALCALAVALL
ncbi:hypothetical protein C8R46DRAFT_1005405 [Mycena filopes]|nr:hypothetical protein C8R46DRAFT_1005405 [Mycena filopes]